MPLPVAATPTNNLISATTSGSQTRTPGAGETAIVIGAVSSGGSGITVSGAGGTWSEISNVTDGTRRVFIWEGTGISSGTPGTVTVAATNTMTCRWTWIAATGIAATTPRDQNGSRTTASSPRTTHDCVGSPVTTPANVLCVCAMALSASAGTISAPSGFTRVTGGSSVSLLNAYGTFAGGLTSDSVTVTTSNITASALGVFASWNGDSQLTGGPFPSHTRRRMTGGLLVMRGGF